jgi:NifU-like protein involved in Fe-S cluster formation
VKYNELTRRYFERAPGAGALRGPDTFRGAAGRRAEGTWVQFDVQLAPRALSGAGAPPVIAAARFAAFGCPHVIAAAAWLAEQAVGRQAVPALPESVQALRERFEAPIEKLGRLLIVEDAWVAAMRAAAGPRH